MRLYCLASISQIQPPTDYIPPDPYEEGADELITYTEYDGPIEPFHNLPSDYRLTEICIGWKTFQDGPKKLYEIQIYQKNSRFLNFAMLRGLATITYMDKEIGSFDLCLAVSKPCSFRYAHDIDLKIRAFCIRNTTTRGIVTPEEELAYNNYAKQINDFWKQSSYITADTLQMEILHKFGPLKLSNSSTSKVLKQKLTDLQTAINLLCDPKTGSYRNITPTVYNPKTNTSNPSRIYQQVECLLYLKETLWQTKRPRTLLHEDKDKFRDCLSLKWNNVFLNNKINFSVFDFQSLKTIEFKKVDLGKNMEFWYKLAARINFATVHTLYLQDCEIQKLEDKFFDFLSQNTSVLRLNDNNITFVSKSISKLIDLHELTLDDNKSLSDDGIPWSDLPTRIMYINLKNTNITTVPMEVTDFKFLRNLIVQSPILKNINWAAFSQRGDFDLTKLSLSGGGGEVNEVQLKDIDADDLILSDLKFKKYDSSGAHFHSLSLINNDFKNFNLADINYEKLRFLTISKNGFKAFSWSYIPKNIRSLDLSHNEIEDISVAAIEEIDFSIFTNLGYIYFKGNAIKSLPKGFENIPGLEALDLSFNKFWHDGDDLNEVLWHRLPKSLYRLYLSHNKIHAVSCYIKNFKIHDLEVTACDLRYICPYLHTNIQNTERDYMEINAMKNPKLEFSIIPNTIYQLPKADVPPTTGKAHSPFGVTNYANFLTTTMFVEEKVLRDTSRTKYNNKAVYEFKADGVENGYACKCCAMCGEFTDEPLFKQQMAPDSTLLLKHQQGSNNIKYGDFHGPFLPSVYYEPGQWRAKVTSRLCVSCKELLKKKIDAAFEEFNKVDGNVVENKKSKNVKTNEVNESPPSHEIAFYNTATTAAAGPSLPPIYAPSYCNTAANVAHPPTFTNNLPPINSLLCEYPLYEPVDPNPDPSYYASWNTSVEYDPSIDMKNISINNQTVTTSYDNNVPQMTVLLDQSGNQVAVWNSSYPSDISNTTMPPASSLAPPYPLQETVPNQSLTTLNYNNTETALYENLATSSSMFDETFYGYNFHNL